MGRRWLRPVIFILGLVLSTGCRVGDDARAQAIGAPQGSVVLRPVLPPQGYGVQDTGRVTSAAYPGGYYPFDIATSPQANWDIVAWSNPAGASYLLPFVSSESFDHQTVANQV
jgi:hypothetical protein